MTDLANALRDEGALDESECFIDATFASAKGGGEQIGPTKRGKGENHGNCRSHGLPLAVSAHAASHHEVTLMQALLARDLYLQIILAGVSASSPGPLTHLAVTCMLYII